MSTQPRILLADDNPEILTRVEEILEGDFRVVGCVADGRSLIEKALALRPNVAVLEISLPGCSGLNAAKEIHKADPGISFVFLTMHHDPDVCRHVLPDMSFGYVLKSFAATELTVAIRELLAGRSFVSPSAMKYRDVS